MKFFCFAYGDFYPSGGMGDYIGSADSLEEAQAKVEANGIDGGEVAQMIEDELLVVAIYCNSYSHNHWQVALPAGKVTNGK